jgi:ribosomal protein L12E/L44/L45/RPP1/RPP2
MKFTFGKKQAVDTVELDNLFTDLQGVLLKHPLVPAANIDVLVSEWINDLLFLAGKITEQELQEAMQTFETAETAAPGAGGGSEKADDDDEDSDDDDDD